MCAEIMGIMYGSGGKAHMVCDLPRACSVGVHAKAASWSKPMNMMDRLGVWDGGIGGRYKQNVETRTPLLSLL
jgi:hypothetical protein